MLLVTVALLASAVAPDSGARNDSGESIHAILPEESPDVFLAKATLRQYLERVVRKDWEGVKRLTHPKALTAGWQYASEIAAVNCRRRGRCSSKSRRTRSPPRMSSSSHADRGWWAAGSRGPGFRTSRMNRSEPAIPAGSTTRR